MLRISLHHLAQTSVQISYGDYVSKVHEYLQDVADRAEMRQQQLVGYNPNLQQIHQQLQTVEYPDPDQALSVLQNGDDLEVFHIYAALSQIAIKMTPRDPRYDTLNQLKTEIRKISDQRDQSTFTQEDAQSLAQQVISSTQQNMVQIAQMVQEAISKIERWNGSPVTIEVGDPPSDIGFNKPSYGTPVSTAQVNVGQQTSWGGSASFTVFADFEESGQESGQESGHGVRIEVDDILEAGDTDFFTDQRIQTDYFSLVYELQHPGQSAQEGEKVLTLYTARPVKDREQLSANDKGIPANIFLTSSMSNADGLAQEYGKRDVWKVRIRRKYLIQTMDSPGVRWFQVKAQEGLVPVESIILLNPWE